MAANRFLYPHEVALGVIESARAASKSSDWPEGVDPDDIAKEFAVYIGGVAIRAAVEKALKK